jgi:CheY-like chemotaxis protein
VASGDGSATGPRVLIVDEHPDLGDLMASILEDEGYDVRRASSAALLHDMRRQAPDVLVLGLPRAEEAFAILDALRNDPTARSVPVVTTAALPAVAEGALASYNVRASLNRPFDLETFLTAVADALGRPPLTASAPSAPTGPGAGLTWAADLLTGYSRAALFRWAQRVRAEPPWCDRPDVPIGAVIDSVPALVEALDLALRAPEGDAGAFLASSPQVLARVRDHARTRARQEVSLPAVVREYALLRNEVWKVFRRHLPEDAGASEVLDVEERVNATLDAVVEQTIETYLSAVAGAVST